jgi:hypothetical protein
MLVHLRRNAIAYLALFVALGGSAYAVKKVGPNDIKRNAIRSKQIKNKAVKLKDLNSKSVGGGFGSSVYFGTAYNFGPIASNAGTSTAVPLTGARDTDSGGLGDAASQLIPPKRLRIQDFTLRASDPVDRAVEAQFVFIQPLVDEPFFGCKIQSGGSQCRTKGRSERLVPADLIGLSLEAPIAPGVLSENDFRYSFRIVPG